ncbi:hypothetical protein SAMN05421546_1551 [Solilutibacter tolerans]|uniref:Uncharacterized protein n=1 Tax=Solilutibacter tolerans TaxID=1604334 RepID=A0A1N6U574_9GAMM|nr:hypothetical protein SAMN05421546_1551 [Lysobacter tolerans]
MDCADDVVAHAYPAVRFFNAHDDRGGSPKRTPWTSESSLHITRRNGYFGRHNHSLHSWSGVYSTCLEANDWRGDTGCLAFLNTNSSIFIEMSEAFGLSHLSIKLKPD